MVLVPTEQSGPAVRMALAGAVLELGATETMTRTMGLVGEPYEQGRSGRLMKVARGLTVGAAAVSVLGHRSRLARAAAGAAYVAGSVVTRFGIFEAGLASARDPKYTVVPQRERLAARERASA
jgi:hypothetical protein